MKAQGTQLSLFETRSSSDPFAVRVSPRARRLTARVHVGGRVEIVVPVGVNARAVRDFVQRFTPWIDRKVAAMQCLAAAGRGRCRSASTSPTPASGSRWSGTAAPAQREPVGAGRTDCWCRPPDRRGARRTAAGLAPGARRSERLAPPPAAAGARPALSGTAGGDPLPAHPLGELLDARHGEPQLLAGVPRSRRGALSVSP